MPFLIICILVVIHILFKSLQIEKKQLELNDRQTKLEALQKEVQIEMNRPQIEITHVAHTAGRKRNRDSKCGDRNF